MSEPAHQRRRRPTGKNKDEYTFRKLSGCDRRACAPRRTRHGDHLGILNGPAAERFLATGADWRNCGACGGGADRSRLQHGTSMGARSAASSGIIPSAVPRPDGAGYLCGGDGATSGRAEHLPDMPVRRPRSWSGSTSGGGRSVPESMRGRLDRQRLEVDPPDLRVVAPDPPRQPAGCRSDLFPGEPFLEPDDVCNDSA